MDRYKKALIVARDLIPSEHLGLDDSTISQLDKARRIHENAQTAFNTVNELLVLDLKNLGNMNRISTITISGSLILLLVCLFLILTSKTTIAFVSGLFSLVLSVITRLVFNKQDRNRRSLNAQVEKYNSLYVMLALFEFSKEIIDQDTRDKTIAKLITDFSG